MLDMQLAGQALVYGSEVRLLSTQKESSFTVCLRWSSGPTGNNRSRLGTRVLGLFSRSLRMCCWSGSFRVVVEGRYKDFPSGMMLQTNNQIIEGK